MAKRQTPGRRKRGARNQLTARSGEYFVAAELHKRGAFAAPFAGDMPEIDLIACNPDRSRTVHVQVKTKRGGSKWQGSIEGCGPMRRRRNETNFWVFVSLGKTGESPRYWIVPDWWMRNDIHRAHQAYLKCHGGTRPGNPNSKHHSIEESRLEQWRDRWDIMGILDE